MQVFEKFSFENNITVEGLTNELAVFYVLESFKKR